MADITMWAVPVAMFCVFMISQEGSSVDDDIAIGDFLSCLDEVVAVCHCIIRSTVINRT